jgi:GNAT superfamily N-acetyltransferase
MIFLSKEDSHILKTFKMRKEEVVLKSYIQGMLGKAWVNCKVNPTTAIVIVADFCFLLGVIDPKEESEIIKILSEDAKGRIIVPENFELASLIESNFISGLKKFNRYAIKWEPDVFDKKELSEFVLAVQSEFTILRINESIYHKALEQFWTADFCSNFASLEEFLKHGIGYVIMKDGEIIAGASSYTYCNGAIEITIETKSEYRRKGLALACASKVILECLDRGIYPRWDAANKNSVALAEKLGYHFDKEYSVYSI